MTTYSTAPRPAPKSEGAIYAVTLTATVEDCTEAGEMCVQPWSEALLLHRRLSKVTDVACSAPA
ncbi:hypothetical protein ACWEQN_47555, partial [Streptomyces sp. NPDC004129]